MVGEQNQGNWNQQPRSNYPQNPAQNYPQRQPQYPQQPRPVSQYPQQRPVYPQQQRQYPQTQQYPQQRPGYQQPQLVQSQQPIPPPETHKFPAVILIVLVVIFLAGGSIFYFMQGTDSVEVKPVLQQPKPVEVVNETVQEKPVVQKVFYTKGELTFVGTNFVEDFELMTPRGTTFKEGEDVLLQTVVTGFKTQQVGLRYLMNMVCGVEFYSPTGQLIDELSDLEIVRITGVFNSNFNHYEFDIDYSDKFHLMPKGHNTLKIVVQDFISEQTINKTMDLFVE
ncbi:hypothetical protein HN587_03725 [Candidatus Woesearchaeota archaeon]|jgi:hypothetical protein|nr:hypothetical protein [Candidatus Woesearchaeota archaeon]